MKPEQSSRVLAKRLTSSIITAKDNKKSRPIVRAVHTVDPGTHDRSWRRDTLEPSSVRNRLHGSGWALEALNSINWSFEGGVRYRFYPNNTCSSVKYVILDATFSVMIG